jgi:hypothetical protein
MVTEQEVYEPDYCECPVCHCVNTIEDDTICDDCLDGSHAELKEVV